MASAADYDPNGSTVFREWIAKPVRDGRDEIDAVAGAKRSRRGPGFDVKSSFKDVEVLVTPVPHQVVRRAGLCAASVSNAEEFHVRVVLHGQPFPQDTIDAEFWTVLRFQESGELAGGGSVHRHCRPDV